MDDTGAMGYPKPVTEQVNDERASTRDQDSNEKPVTPANATPGFLRLPAELRNIIYELVLPRDNFYVSVRTTEPVYVMRCLAEPATIPALLATCRLIRNDTLPVFYGTNIFALRTGNKKDFRDTLAWLQSMDQRAVAGIVKLVVTGTTACVRHEYSHSFDMSLEHMPESRRIAGGERYYGFGHISVPCLPADSRLRCGERIVREFAQRRAGAETLSVEQTKFELIAMVEEVHKTLHLPWWHRPLGILSCQDIASPTTHTSKSGVMRQKKHNKKKGSGTRSRTKNRDSNSNQNTTNFPFLRLPPELRNMIYELALPMHQSYVPIAPSAPEAHAIVALSCFRPIAVPALLATSRTIRTEALPIFYGNNTFILDLGEDRAEGDEKQFRSLAWLEATDARGIASMTALFVIGQTNCVFKKHSHMFATRLNLVQPEQLFNMNKLFVEGMRDCPRAGARMRFANKLVREHALPRASKETSPEQAKAELVAILKRAHRALDSPWWTCVVKVKLWWVLLVVVIAFGVLYFIRRIVA
ncbi:hypothetical protein LTR97_005619 [Elasticomyces elasticus]|uniref:2EXR domain-containing protein n=1 Tax=Elasticomyces elasticus TaxID=574655 RepID=A0AAN7W5C5_9PEZI|nr:hypothetical protein LTR97_005619 [Elasticomyces elasticus]